MGNGTTKIVFKKRDGTKVPLTIDNDLKNTMDAAVARNKNNWDYLAIIAGIPGVGKSTLANNTLAPYVCPWFSEKYIAFTDEEFINITTKCPNESAVVLDESFAPLNSRLIFTPEFQRIVNHIQLVRQKRLKIFLCLPNFFDLAKGIAIFRASHLFVPYEGEGGKRGQFLAFGRNEKRKLYVLGSKFMDYGATEANFTGRYFKNGAVLNNEIYEDKKRRHFLAQNKKINAKRSSHVPRYTLGEVFHALNEKYKIHAKEIGQMFHLTDRSIRLHIKNFLKAEKAKKEEGR